MKKIGLLILSILMMISLLGCQSEPKEDVKPDDQSQQQGEDTPKEDEQKLLKEAFWLIISPGPVDSIR